ncbi:ankyrin repeat-containing domain protein [Aspergillus leporis]|uniref:Ankyrin repeat-containing domain protein n=1 Tax=Aspergillus leporis TaxID=41062 RepID=A0A5N5XAZ7_9EURO|nr:ankyrin repeat-containing domain protein [Aspergillus leporis]
MGIEDQGARSLATLARNTLESKIDPLLQDQVMVPEMIDLRNAAIVQWPQSTPTHLPIHWSLVNTSLGKALLRDGVRAVKMLIALGVDANSMLPCGYRISGVAALTAAGKVIEYLLGVPEIRIDEKVNAYGHLEETAMVLAYKTSQLQIYGQFLAANGGIIPARTMLYICAIEPHATLISVIALNADVRKSIRTKHPVNHNTPLHAAVLNEDEQMLTTILELGRKTTTIINSFAVFLNATNSDGQTPLMLAVEHKMRDAVTTLLEQEGIEVNARAAGGRTALWYAARVLDVDLCNTLRHFGADEGNPAPGRQMWTTKGTPFNALLEAYDQAHEEFTHNKNRLEANANFERAKNKIERIGWLLDSIGSNPNLPDHYTLRVPRNTVLENFPEWQDIFT